MGSVHLVRHGQASFGSENYDQLSQLGYQQAIALGNAWEAGAWEPTLAIAGSLERHAQTAIAALDIIEGDGYDVDAGWNAETYEQFTNRVMSAFAAAVERAGQGQRVVVFTSGGPISLVLSQLLAGDDSLFQTLNDVTINASVTTIINGRTGPRLLTFNEHTHLPPDMITFR